MEKVVVDLLVQFIGSIFGFSFGYLVAYIFYKREQNDKIKNEKKIMNIKLNFLKDEASKNYENVKEILEQKKYEKASEISTIFYEDVMKTEFNKHMDENTLRLIYKIYVNYYTYIKDNVDNAAKVKLMFVREDWDVLKKLI
ncbi:MAG TPA: hypothetical protein DCP90_01905 [Clostridiales bacterium]|nr:MAG: hypothetical protein A2Y22_08750 [Clostridiales bacterium GWD2_32_59]HAN09347.1 hypothetical protein [Clostridiales bacterium]